MGVFSQSVRTVVISSWSLYLLRSIKHGEENGKERKGILYCGLDIALSYRLSAE